MKKVEEPDDEAITKCLDDLPVEFKPIIARGHARQGLLDGLITIEQVEKGVQDNPEALKLLFTKHGYYALKGIKSILGSRETEEIDPLYTAQEVLEASAENLEDIKDHMMENTFGKVQRIQPKEEVEESSTLDEESVDESFKFKLGVLLDHAKSLPTFKNKSTLYQFFRSKYIAKTNAKRADILQLCDDLKNLSKEDQAEKIEEVLTDPNSAIIQNRGLGLHRFKHHGFVNTIGERTHKSNSTAEDLLIKLHDSLSSSR